MAADKTNIDMLQSWGIASARNTSGVVLPREDGSAPGYFDVPQGPSLVRWDIVCHKKLWAFQPHGDAVFCMRLSPNGRYIVTLSYGGEIGIWNVSYSCLFRGAAECSSLHHVSWSSDGGSIAMVGNGFDSKVMVYSFKEGSDSSALCVVLQWLDRAGIVSKKHWGERSAGSSVTPSVSGGDEAARVQRFNPVPLTPAFETCEFLPSGCLVATENCPNGTADLIHMYSAVGEHLKLVELQPALVTHRLDVVLISPCCNGSFLVGLQGGHTLVFDDSSLDIKAQFCTEVTARTCVWDGGLLLFPTDTGKLVWWSTSGEKVSEVKVLEQDYYVRLAWDEPQRTLFVCGFTTLNHVTLQRESSSGKVEGAHTTMFSHDGGRVEGVVRGFQIACCGLEFSPTSKHIAVGDLAGTIWVCPVNEDVPVASANVGMSVRCVVWLDETSLLVGTLDGLLYRWNFEESEEEPTIAHHLEGSVIHMRWAHNSKLLGLGTSKGKLHVFALGSEEMSAVTQFTAHKAQDGEQDLQFGQLGKQAEIWSLCWSPSDHMIVTCSEDQTSKVWNTASWALVATLTGHQMAVTSVDWKQIGDRSVIATCSDDQTIRLVNGHSFQLMRTLHTKDVHGWYTLTYLTFEPSEGSSRLACATQNGHILVWDVLSGGQLVARGKVHCGSVEGLKWEGHCRRLVSCAADCNVHLFKID